jgi:hypothetical protein
MDLHGVWKLELKGHNTYLFANGEWIKFFVIQFLQRLCCFDILSPTPNLVFNLETWLFFELFVSKISLVLPLHFFKNRHKLCPNVHQSTCDPIFGFPDSWFYSWKANNNLTFIPKSSKIIFQNLNEIEVHNQKWYFEGGHGSKVIIFFLECFL